MHSALRFRFESIFNVDYSVRMIHNLTIFTRILFKKKTVLANGPFRKCQKFQYAIIVN